MGADFTRLGPAASDSAALFAPGELRDNLGFALRAVRRRFKLAAVIMILFGGATALLSRVLPRKYHAEARLYALPADGAPGVLRAASGEPSGLAPGAAESIFTGDNLDKLVREHDLLRRFEESRTPLLRALDRLRQIDLADENARSRALAGYLRKNLTVQVKGTEVILSFDWPEAQTAYAVVRECTKRLVAARREAEILPLERKVAALQESWIAAHKSLDDDVARVDDAIQARRRGARAATVRGLQADGRFRDLPDARLVQLRSDLIVRRKEVAALEEVRRKRLSELQGELAEQKATLGPGNAALRDTEEKIASLGRQAAQVETMKSEEQSLLGEYVRLGGKEIELESSPAPAWPPELLEDDALISSSKARLSMDLSSMQRLQGELDDAKAALASARAAFASRYAVLSPAEIPEQPAFPRPWLMLPAGILGGILLAFLGAVAADLRRGVIRESWQAQRGLDLPVLAEVPRP